jgi:hypothetical protein
MCNEAEEMKLKLFQVRFNGGSSASMRNDIVAAILTLLGGRHEMNEKQIGMQEFFDCDWLTGKDASYTNEYGSELEYILAC